MLIQNKMRSQYVSGFIGKIAPSDVSVSPKYARSQVLPLSGCDELTVIRHYTQLSQKNMGIETACYPLGSCTMKYNPRVSHQVALWQEFSAPHPLAMSEYNQGLLAALYDLQNYLQLLTGFNHTSLSPLAGAQGELTGLMMIRAYHDKREDHRTEVIVPDTAHGTNPASAVCCGYRVKEVKTDKLGNVDLDSLAEVLSDKTAAMMLTHPSTVGIFDANILKITAMVHDVGAQMYYDGANLNALLGNFTPASMGFDVMHINLHKTFATPHGCGGPGGGPVCAADHLAPYLPIPMLAKTSGTYYWLTESDCSDTIGRMTAFQGNVGVLLRAYCYARMLGSDGLPDVSNYAVLNANYLMKKLADIGYTMAYPQRLASHEFIITLQPQKKQYGVTAMDVAKRLLDYGFHAPTVYFPLLVPECLLIEPTETETKQQLDKFIEAMADIYHDIETRPEYIKQAPHHCGVARVDEVKAARDLVVSN